MPGRIRGHGPRELGTEELARHYGENYKDILRSGLKSLIRSDAQKLAHSSWFHTKRFETVASSFEKKAEDALSAYRNARTGTVQNNHDLKKTDQALGRAQFYNRLYSNLNKAGESAGLIGHYQELLGEDIKTIKSARTRESGARAASRTATVMKSSALIATVSTLGLAAPAAAVLVGGGIGGNTAATLGHLGAISSYASLEGSSRAKQADPDVLPNSNKFHKAVGDWAQGKSSRRKIAAIANTVGALTAGAGLGEEVIGDVAASVFDAGSTMVEEVTSKYAKEHYAKTGTKAHKKQTFQDAAEAGALSHLERIEHATFKIQTAYRANRWSKVISAKKEQRNEAATKIQAVFRGKLGRDEAKQLRLERHDSAATKLQTAFRNKQSNKRLDTFQGAVHGAVQKNKEEKAAGTLQTAFRNLKSNKRLGAMQAAVKGVVSQNQQRRSDLEKIANDHLANHGSQNLRSKIKSVFFGKSLAQQTDDHMNAILSAKSPKERESAAELALNKIHVHRSTTSNLSKATTQHHNITTMAVTAEKLKNLRGNK